MTRHMFLASMVNPLILIEGSAKCLERITSTPSVEMFAFLGERVVDRSSSLLMEHIWPASQTLLATTSAPPLTQNPRVDLEPVQRCRLPLLSTIAASAGSRGVLEYIYEGRN